MKSLIQVASELQDFFIRRSWRFCFIGGLALQRWGQPRLTIDVDISLLTGFGQEKKYIDELLIYFTPRIVDADDFARKNRVLLLKSESGVGIDIALAGLPFEEEVIERASEFEYLPGIKLRICSAEDLVILKAFADRSQDWADVESIVERQSKNLDRNYIVKHLKPLSALKDAPWIMSHLEKMFNSKNESGDENG